MSKLHPKKLKQASPKPEPQTDAVAASSDLKRHLADVMARLAKEQASRTSGGQRRDDDRSK